MNYLFGSIFTWVLMGSFGCGQNTVPVVSKVSNDSIYTYGKGTYDGIGKYYFGREIAHVMGAGGAGWLERAEREKEEGIAKVLKALPVTDSSVVADIGAGTGYYSFKIGKKVPVGHVYAVDIQDEMLGYMQRTIAEGGYKNVTVVKGSEQNPNLADNSVDLAIMVDVYHELAFPHEMLQNLRKVLKPTGRILLLEYKGEDPSIPIKALHKMTIQQAEKEMVANGFSRIAQNVPLPIQHFLLFGKNE